MVLKRPSEYFKKEKTVVDNSIQELVKSPELNTFSDAFEAFKRNLSKIETLSEFSETLDNYRVNVERVNHLSEKVEDIQTEIQNLLKKEDLDRAMMSQLLIVEQSIREVQSKVKGINEKNLTEIRLDISGLTETVSEFLEVEVPKYKKLVVDSELRTNNRYEELEQNINSTLEGIGEFIDKKYDELTETLQGINEQSLAGIIQDFKILDKTVSKFKEEEIPKYKGLIVETERKTETKIIEFQNKLEETLSNLAEKISLIDEDNTHLVDSVNQKIDDVKKLSDKVSRYLNESKSYNEEYKNEITKKVSDLEVDIIRNETHIRVQNKNLKQIQEEVEATLEKINFTKIDKKESELENKIKHIEEILSKFNAETLTEGLLNEPPELKNNDPLSPLDQNFVTLDQLQEHYRLFINRIQQQLATLGGGGETRLEFLDDVDRSTAKINGYVLQYDSSVGKFIGTSYAGGGNAAITISDTPPLNPQSGNLWYDSNLGRTFIYYIDIDGSQWVDASPSGGFSLGDKWVSTNVGIHTFSNVGIGTDDPTSKLTVEGDALVTGIITGSSFRPSSGYIQAADGTNALYIYSGTGNVAFQGTIGASKINNASGYNAIDFSATTTPNVLVPNDLIVSGVNTSSITIPTQLRAKSVAEKTTLVTGNTVGLAFTSGEGNVAICTNPTGDITLNVTDIPTDSSFDNHSISFSVIVTQTGTARTCIAVNLNGVSRTIRWAGGSLSNAISGVTTSSGYDIFTFTGINTVGSASTTENYVVLGSVNGGFN